MTDNLTHSLTHSEELLTELKLLNPGEGKFRFQNQKAMFTYKTHIDKVRYEGVMRQMYTSLKKIYIAHENGINDPKTPYEHTHVVVDFGTRVDTKNPRHFDFDGIHPHISLITKPLEWKKACKYICKEDKTVVLQPDEVISTVDDIWNYNNIQEALQNVENLRDIMPTIAAYQHRPLAWDRPIYCPISCLDDMYVWQRNIYDHIMTAPNDRTVMWVADQDGCKGKTQFIKFMAINHPGKVMWIVPSGNTRDIIHVFMENIKAGWRGDTVLINLSRSATTGSDMAHIYRVIEDIKDGMIFSSKYMGGTMLMPSPHVLVMSNRFPETYRLTGDRWRIFVINQDKSVTETPGNVPPVTLNNWGGFEW